MHPEAHQTSKMIDMLVSAQGLEEGVDGLLRDKTRPPGKAPLLAETVRRVIDLALGPPPGETTRWTGRMRAKAAGVSAWSPLACDRGNLGPPPLPARSA